MVIIDRGDFVNKDRFGNPIDPVVGYARGRILQSSLEEGLKRKQAYGLIKNRINKLGVKSLYNFTGLDKTFPLEPNDVGILLV